MPRDKHLPPSYWLSILLSALRTGDFAAAEHADRRLKEFGIEISLRRMIPGGEMADVQVAR